MWISFLLHDMCDFHFSYMTCGFSFQLHKMWFFLFQLREMCYFLIILLIVVASFGVVRQAIHYQDEEPNWFQVRNMFFYPYFMIYGELFADEIDSKLWYFFAVTMKSLWAISIAPFHLSIILSVILSICFKFNSRGISRCPLKQD